MAFTINAISIIILSFLGVAMSQVKVEKDDNIEPFALMCRIYNVAKNPPINYVDLEEADKIVQEIDALNTSLMDQKRLNETEELWSSVGAQVKPTLTRETALAQLSLNQITQKAHTILEEIKKIKVSENIERAKAEFNQVIFGENGNESELCHATVKDVGNRTAVCGSPGAEEKGSHAGNNLVVDFFCLCAQRTDEEGVNQVCGFYVGRISHFYGWDDKNGPWGSSTMWASIKGGCSKHMHEHTKSTAEARHILDQFLKHLKMGGVYMWGESSSGKVEEGNQKAGMLGTAVGKKGATDGNGPVCDGKKGGKTGGRNVNPGGVCAYYGEDNQWENISWKKQLNIALNTVENINNQTATIQRDIEKLQMLQHRAEEMYETAKVISEFQNTVGVPEALQNATGNLTAFNTTRIRSYSYSRHAYFALPWVLFL
ncbi:Variant surface glycoprotein [Trypanosoma congolense IL3000]|uniref:Variant surface glycoprotein n=1 Tax=Trypanosoma congolense (strain IL3000) TaxID=1068625 RepID=F9W9P1_TRYCI|nr:Variant surface glycoprotein [Trypanosoma congolense IL3000]